MQKIISFLGRNRFLFLILIVAIGLRFYNITGVPPALNWDEVSHGYNAYSLLKTGRDEWGKVFPIIFRAYGDYKLPLYIYLTALSEAIFGLNAFAVRLPSVLAGISTVIFTYLLAKELFNQRVAIISALLVAIEPWSLFLSRGAFEANLSLALIVAAIYFLLVGLEKNKQLITSAILLGLSVWTYNSARIFVPLLVLAMFLIYRRPLGLISKKDKKVVASCLAIIAIFFIPMFYQLARPVGQARYGKVVIIDEGAIAQINELRSKSKFSQMFLRLVYNKGTYFISKFAGGYISHFSPKFLFFEGGTQYQFSVPHKGLLYLADAPFLLIGLIYLLTRKTKSAWLVLGWLVLAPIPSSLTREAPQVLRAITMLPLPMLITAIGLTVFGEKVSKNLKFVAVALYAILVFASLEAYLRAYFLDYPQSYSWSWQYGYQQIVDFAKENYPQYDKIIVTKKYGEPHEFFLFFWPWSPTAYQADKGLIRFYQSNWYWVDRFDKFYFVNDWQIPKNGDLFVLESKGKADCSLTRCLLVTSPGNYPLGWKKLKTINFLDGSAAFEIYEN